MTATADATGARIADALERIAMALEQSVLESITKPGLRAMPEDYDLLDELPAAPPRPVPVPAAPPVQPAPIPAAPAGLCPVHNTAWRLVPAGTSSRTGKPYDAFWACSTKGCNQKPPR